jgi:hypothetical protein
LVASSLRSRYIGEMAPSARSELCVERQPADRSEVGVQLAAAKPAHPDNMPELPADFALLLVPAITCQRGPSLRKAEQGQPQPLAAAAVMRMTYWLETIR